MMRSKILAASLIMALTASTMPSPAAAAGVGFCKEEARRYANRKAGAPQVVTGLVGGAIVGGLIGAAVGGKKAVRTGLIVGGATGAVAGGVNANSKWEKYYWRRYKECRREW